LDHNFKIREAKDYLEDRNYQKMVQRQNKQVKRTSSADFLKEHRNLKKNKKPAKATEKRDGRSSEMRITGDYIKEQRQFLISMGGDTKLKLASSTDVTRPKNLLERL